MKRRIYTDERQAFTVPELLVAMGLIGLMASLLLLLGIQCVLPDPHYLPAAGPVPAISSVMLYPWYRPNHSDAAAYRRYTRLRFPTTEPAFLWTNAAALDLTLPAQ